MWTGRPATARLRYSLAREAHRPTCAQIDLGAMVHNLDVMRAVVSPAAVIAVVKADAYGHGAAVVAAALERAGVDALAVALVEEGLELRSSAISRPILVLGGVHAAAAAEAIRAGLTPVVYDAGQIGMLAAASRGRPVGVHVKFDTGMSRLGIGTGHLEIARLVRELRRFPGVRPIGAMTHLASADADDPGPTLLQLERFSSVLDGLRRRGIAPEMRHAAASAAAIRFPEARLDMVRLGISLYGCSPFETGSPGLVSAMRVRTEIVQLREIPEGATVGYGGTFTAPGRTRIATLPMGYADGLSRHLSNRGHVLVRGRRAPIVGNVCMDMAMIDVTEVPEVAVGDEVVVLGRQDGSSITAQDVAACTGTIPYEVLTSLSRRVPRVYLPPAGQGV